MGLEEAGRSRRQEPLTPGQIDILAEPVICVLRYASAPGPLRTTKGEAQAALGGLRRIVEQAKSASSRGKHD